MLTLLGNQAEWVLTMVACFRQGFVVLPCTEQLRAGDLRHRLQVAQPALVVADDAQRGGPRRRRLGRAGALVALEGDSPSATLTLRSSWSRPIRA